MDLRQLHHNPAVRDILEERARALAHQEAAEDTRQGEETLIFRLGNSLYGVSARLVREVQPLSGYTPLPGTPPFILGLVNLRGRLLAALDIRPLLALATILPQPGAMLLIVSASGMDVALLADEVVEIRPGAADLSPSLASAEGQMLAWVRGIDRDLAVQIDLALLLADPGLIVNQAGERGVLA
jgi:purine-binding chemotaxis protein CheW